MKAKSFSIFQVNFVEAYKRVKANKGGAGIDKESIQMFEKDLRSNLYKIWNRMSSGSYFPPPVRGVEIPKASGGTRTLGIPTVGDRIAQMVVTMELEEVLEPIFHKDSYGYRPGKSPLDAVGVTRKRCWEHDWVVEFDIRGLFDNVSHSLLLKALKLHTQKEWVLLYVERWIKVPLIKSSGEQIEREKGVPQGGCISPILANLFLHYVFDKWMELKHPDNPFCRYSDDGLVHCRTLEEAIKIKRELEERFKNCELELHPEKTKIVYCKDSNRKGKYENTTFNFLGFTFKQLQVRSRNNKMFMSFQPIAKLEVVSKAIEVIKYKWRLHQRTDLSLQQLAKLYNPIIRGWINYYGAFNKRGLSRLGLNLNFRIMRWAHRKYKKLRGHKRNLWNWLNKTRKDNINIFVHWQLLK